MVGVSRETGEPLPNGEREGPNGEREGPNGEREGPNGERGAASPAAPAARPPAEWNAALRLSSRSRRLP